MGKALERIHVNIRFDTKVDGPECSEPKDSDIKNTSHLFRKGAEKRRRGTISGQKKDLWG
jgi:hypothetical protein